MESEQQLNIVPPIRAWKDRLCDHCGKRAATKDWVGEGGSLGYIHGIYERWCDLCVINAQIEFAEKAQARLPAMYEERQRLEESGGSAA